MYALLFAAAVLPPALIVAALGRALGRPVAPGYLALAFVCGAALLLPVYGLLDLHDLLVRERLGVELGTAPYPKGLYRGMVLASAPEELCRFSLAWAFAAWAGGERRRAGALVLGVAVMLGFASLENCMYVRNHGWALLPARTLTAIPFNAALGVILGACLGAALARREGRGWRLLGALALIIAVHGAYDTPLLILYETNHKAGAGEAIALSAAAYVVFGLTLLAALLLVHRQRRAWLRQSEGSKTSA